MIKYRSGIFHVQIVFLPLILITIVQLNNKLYSNEIIT